MQERHSVVPKEIFQHPSGISLVPEVVMEGYLFKRSTNAFKTWNRRWFQIRDNTFLYSHRNNDNQVPTMMEENLKLCLVRQAPPNIDRMCCFELVTPSKTHILQADSEILCKGWIRALQRTIQHLHEECIHNTKEIPIFDDDKNELKHSPATTQSQMNDNGSEGSSEITPRGEGNGQGKIKEAFIRSVIAPLSIREFYIQTRQLAGNTICCDCGCVDAKWISINLGIIICIECSGVHRSLGVQVSKVRSLTMDSLDCQQQDVMLSLGNKTVNSIFMEHYDKHKTQYPLISGETSRAEREIFIKAKYVHKLFTSSNKQRTNENGIYFNESGQEDDILSHQYLLLPTAETVSVKSFDRPESRTSDCSEGKFDKSDSDDYFNSDKITESIIGGNMAELLKCLAKGFDLNSIINGNTLLHIAVKNNNQSIIEFLVLNGAKINSFNEDLDTPLHVAVSVGDPLLVYQLIKRNADKSIKNRRGFTPLEWAVESEHANVVVLFRLVDLKSECTNTDSSNTMLDENIEDFLINLQMKENENNLSNV
uniref:Arf-GAP with coiled-coil, ANK repeat and PH domain-containing protein 2 n=1 Tax=Rhabditophanes sp. KR3021 TaxID=114890 RepID=A0AC35U6D1_9BILA